MKIEIRNIGPVRTISVDMRKLTIFTGPNNSGKSIVATVVYSALDNIAPAVLALARQVAYEVTPDSEEVLGDLAGYLAERADSGVFSIDELPRTVKEWIPKALERVLRLYMESVYREIERAYGASLLDLRRVKNRPTVSELRVTSDWPEWTAEGRVTAKGVSITTTLPEMESVWPKSTSDSFREAADVAQRRSQRQLRIGRSQRQLQVVARIFLEELIGWMFVDFPVSTRYLPAARSGMMQSQKLLAGTIVREAARAGIREMRVPSLSGVVSDFIGDMIEIDDDHESPLAEVASELETEILHGSIAVLSSGIDATRELFFVNESGEFPLTRTSSMVSEMAPIVLLLRYALSPGDLLIIEEPEAHLHPRSQVRLALFLARLITEGLQILLTTHSEFFLQQLNNIIASSALRPDELRDAGISSAVTISPDDVSAYWFSPTNNGVVGNQLDITTSTGVSEQSFGAVSEELYNESVSIGSLKESDV